MMPTDEALFEEQREIMTQALLKMSKLAQSNSKANSQYLLLTKLFVLGILSNAADMAEVQSEGASHWLYAEIEAAARQRGIEGIQKAGGTMYSLSGIAADDMPNAMNYIGQNLATTLFKSIHELPAPLRTQEMLLRGVEALLGNLLHQKFSNAHDILDSLCEHVHSALDDLTSRRGAFN
jgi:hypothetical protein